MSNLALLCRRHHRAVHEEGYQVDRQADGTLSFGRPDGSLLPEVPPPATPPANPVEVLRARHDAQGFIFTRAPIDSDGASDLLQRLKTVRRLPTLLSARQLQQAAEFVSGFSKLAATAPWTSFTLEVNPLKVGERDVAAVDGLLIVG